MQQANLPTQPNIENVKNAEAVLYTIPQELSATMPETVWASLSLDQKKEVLRQNNLFEKFFPTNENLVEQSQTEEIKVAPARPEIVVEKAQKVEKVAQGEFEKAVKEAKAVEKGSVTIEDTKLSVDEAKRVEEEKASSANVKTFKLFGYQPTQPTVANAKSISNDNPVSDSKTWSATLIAKILGLFQ